MMIYRILADLTVLIHFAYVFFVLSGLLLTLLGWAMSWHWVRNRWFRSIHLAMILIVVIETWIGIAPVWKRSPNSATDRVDSSS